MKKRFSSLLYSCLFTVTGILSFPKLTLAQLRLGTGVQPGLEGYLLEYQQRRLPLDKLSGASGCSAGFGASCNKTGAILQKIVREYSGLDYPELLAKAAGGAENYQKFARLYSNPSAVSLMPYSSFWRKGNEYVLDSYKNTGIGTLNTVETSSLREIASNFKFAPATWGNDNISLRQGIVGLKTSYGLILVEEALKIPEIEQKIAAASLNESEASFHQQQFQNAVSALYSNSPTQLTNSLFYLLSNPYTDVVASLNRPDLSISTELTKIEGIALKGEVENIVAIIGEGSETILTASIEEVIKGSATSAYTIAGVGGVALLILLASGDGSSGDSSAVISDIPAPSEDTITLSSAFPPNVTLAANPPISLIPEENRADNNVQNTLELPEPSFTNTFLLFSSIFLLLNRKKVMI